MFKGMSREDTHGKLQFLVKYLDFANFKAFFSFPRVLEECITFTLLKIKFKHNKEL